MRGDARPAKPLVFDRAGIREVDRQAIESHDMPGLVLMENAAMGAVAIARDMLAGPKPTAPIVITCGPGNNGGDGYAMARLLHGHGIPVTIVTRTEPRPGSDAAVNARAAGQLNIPVTSHVEPLVDATLIIDALLGTGLDRPVGGGARDLIDAINASSAPVLAIDIPSGLDADTGQPLGAAVQATATATFVGWKRGFLDPAAATWTGTIHVVDIGVPRSLAQSLAIDQPG
ncbi:MAG: NAD(P)H-hydrate epimerase [Phycisphaerales bacterium]|nr:NAD(P)H-hydrate epimerase [Phycisphaerales bacterium]